MAIHLRRIEERDLSTLFDYRNDWRVYRWCRQRDALHRAGHKTWFEWQAHDQSVSMYAIVNGAYDAIGVCGLTDIDRVNSRAEFSLYIGPDWQGQGYGKGALVELLEKAFKVENLHLVWGETFDGNPAAKMFESLGFKRDGTRRQFYFREGHYTDAHLYSITRGEWITSLVKGS